MATIKVRYTVTVNQTIDWPDDEMGDFSLDNLECNLDPERGHIDNIYDVLDVLVEGQDYQF